jgi:hypothetical protein
LDVIEDERLIENAKRVGAELAQALRGLNIGEVRGRGLLVGVELESAELAEDVVNRMRDAGVLINRTGPQNNVLKIRPPLIFTAEHAKLLGAALAAALAASSARPSVRRTTAPTTAASGTVSSKPSRMRRPLTPTRSSIAASATSSSSAKHVGRRTIT